MKIINEMLVLAALTKRNGPISGSALAKESGLGSGTLYPTLISLEEQKLISGEWEGGDEGIYPRRRLYSVTDEGVQFLVNNANRALIVKAFEDLRKMIHEDTRG